MRQGQSIDELCCPEPNSGCWLWLGSTMKVGGYGTGMLKKKAFLAHRLSYQIFKGAIPPNIYVCHKCDTPSCINPDHLFLGTAKENMADMRRKGRQPTPRSLGGNARLTDEQVHAIRGDQRKLHEIAPEYGIGIAQVSAIRRLRAWKHLPIQEK